MPNILFMDGLDHYQTSQFTTKWNSQIGLDSGLFTPPIITTDAGRKGYGLATKQGGSAWRSFADTSTVAIGFAFRPMDIVNKRIVALRDEGTIQLYLQLSSTGAVQVFRGNGTLIGNSAQILSPAKFYYIELKSAIASTTGTITLRINGQASLGFSATSVNTQVSSVARVNILQFGDPTNSTVFFHYDDVWVTDGDLLGVQYVDVLRPNGGVPGYMDMQSIGAGSHYQAIDDTNPDDDSTYISSSSNWIGSVQFSEFENIRETTGGGIAGVAVHTYAKKEYGNTRGFKTGLYPGTPDSAPGSVQYYGDPLYAETEYAYHSDPYANNPGANGGTGGTWTVQSINALKAGFLRYV